MSVVPREQLKRLPRKNTDQITAFLKTISIDQRINLYSYNNLTYINIAPLLPVLSVDGRWLISNTKDPRYYIIVERKLYVSKYGITKLISESREEISFKLQDYLFELLYTVETTGVATTDLKSRDELMQCIDVISQRLTEHQASASEEIADMRYEYTTLKKNYDDLLQERDEQAEKFNELQEEYSRLKVLANALAKFARSKSKIIPKILSSEQLDDSDNSTDEIDQIAHDGKKAYRRIIAPTSLITCKADRKDKRLTYALMRSADNRDFNYEWALSELVSESFKIDSIEFVENNGPAPSLMVWYADIELSDWSKKIFELFIELNPWISEDKILRFFEAAV
jgi:hypothetical protein